MLPPPCWLEWQRDLSGRASGELPRAFAGETGEVCATNIWAVNSAACSETFMRFTSERLGLRPQETDLKIVSSRVRGSARSFILTPMMCDCRALIGLGDDFLVEGEVKAEDWLGWLRGLPEHVPHVSRLAVLHAWSPKEDEVRPARARGVQVAAVDEAVLRDLRDDALLTIDYPAEY